MRIRQMLADQGMMRLAELTASGVTATTVSRMVKDGEVIRLARGLYGLADGALDAHHSLAEAAKRYPNGVVCLVSALAFHGLTDQLPARVWLAIGDKDWVPKAPDPPVRIIRFSQDLLCDGVEVHLIEGVAVRIFGVAKTIADCFRHRAKIGLAVALEGLQEALRQRKATPAAVMEAAERSRVGSIILPYLQALTVNV